MCAPALLGVVHFRTLERDVGLPGGSRLRRAWVSMSDQTGNPHTGLEIGRTLRQARQRRGLSLQQVEVATKIRSRYLRDLENENFDVLPAVYVLGSLKTYAEHLGLDGAAMTGELKRRQASLHAEQDQMREEPPSVGPRRLLASLGRLVGIGETVEDEAGTMSDPVHSPGLYVSLAVVLVFILATYLASSIRGEDPPSVSQVRKPEISQLPSRVTLIGSVENDERNTGDGNKENQAKTPAEEDKVKADLSGQVRDAPQTAQASSSSATAFASAPASTPAGAPAASSASAPATATPAPANVKPEQAAKEEPGGGRGMAAAAPAGPPARVPRSQGLQEPQAGPVDTPWLGKGVPNKVKKAMDSAW